MGVSSSIYSPQYFPWYAAFSHWAHVCLLLSHSLSPVSPAQCPCPSKYLFCVPLMFPSSRYHKNPGGSSVESAKTDKNASYQKCGLGLNWSEDSVLVVGGSGANYFTHSTLTKTWPLTIFTSWGWYHQPMWGSWHILWPMKGIKSHFAKRQGKYVYGSRMAGTLNAES